jgi:hypothetical protein
MEGHDSCFQQLRTDHKLRLLSWSKCSRPANFQKYKLHCNGHKKTGTESCLWRRTHVALLTDEWGRECLTGRTHQVTLLTWMVSRLAASPRHRLPPPNRTKAQRATTTNSTSWTPHKTEPSLRRVGAREPLSGSLPPLPAATTPAEMASISGAAAAPSSSACRLRLRRQLLLRPSHLRLRAPHSIADLSRSSSSSSSSSNSSPSPLEAKPAQGQNGAHGHGSVEKDPIKLWDRYLEWLYQHKELGLFVDVSRMGFTEEFLQQMEPRMQRAFAAMRDLEKGAIANPDESRMVGHYWLRNPELAPNSFLRSKIESTLDSILDFSHDVVSGKVFAKFSICFVINQQLLGL